jgi:plasmid stabilization system protein ParE
MGRVRLSWSLEAKADLKRYRAHVAQHLPKDAKAFFRGLRAYVGQLRGMPEMGAVLDDAEDPEVHEIYYGNFRIIYRYTGKRVIIMTVRRGAQNLDFNELTD